MLENHLKNNQQKKHQLKKLALLQFKSGCFILGTNLNFLLNSRERNQFCSWY
jgi:hypothetical protein